MSLWPFRAGNDDRFQTSLNEDSIYSSIGKDLPPNSYETEIARYLQWRWRRGFIHSVFPCTCYGAFIGFCVGFRQSRTEGRYIGRYKIMWRYTSTFAAVGLLTTAAHHMLVVRNGYTDRLHYPILSGTSGAVVLTVASQMGTIGQGFFIGSMIGILYALACYGAAWYNQRHLGIFLRQQQLQQVPVHKVSPELQPMYRAYLFDNRPIEDQDIIKRRSIFLSRFDDDDPRLDAESFLINMTPEFFDWINFPDWWPLKLPTQTEEDQILYARRQEEELERRRAVFLDTQDGVFLKRKNRAKAYRE